MINDGLLRYKVSDWRQLPQVQSNNSNKLTISVAEFVQDKRLNGTRIQVTHEDFGVLFACVVNGGGDIVSESEENLVNELTPEQILSELQKFGYYITYKPTIKLPIRQLEYLMSIRGLNFDKIRILYVHEYIYGIKQIKWHVVAFNVKECPDWINNWYSPHKNEFLKALNSGGAMNLSKVSRTEKFNWSFLVDFVANIEDIVEDNA